MARVRRRLRRPGRERRKSSAERSFSAHEWRMKPRPCEPKPHRPYARRESGGRRCRQPGQIRKEAATTISHRVVPAPTSLSLREAAGDVAIQKETGLLRYARNDG